ncbi:MAG: hypothetical protein KDK39_18395 [Leptospiraceae bacterium]|nr:hypothetical protein [Leptospiraceae bacterium]
MALFVTIAPEHHAGRPNKRNRLVLFLLLFAMAASVWQCVRFQVEELEQNTLISLPVVQSTDNTTAGIVSDSIRIQQNQNVYFGWPDQALVSADRIFLRDSQRNAILVFDAGDTRMSAVVLPRNSSPGALTDIQKVQLPPGQVGAMVTNPVAKLICFGLYQKDKALPQYRSTWPAGSPAARPIATGSMIEQHGQRFHCLDENLEVRYTLANDDQGDEGLFYAVKSVFMDNTGRISLWHSEWTNHNQWQERLSILKPGSATIHVNLDASHFTEPGIGNRDNLAIETVMTAPEGDSITVALSRRSKSSYEMENKFFYHLVAPDYKARLILQSDDPNDYFACTMPSDGLRILNSSEDGTSLLIKTYNKEAEYLKNERIRLDGIRAAWQDVWCEPGGSFYTSRLFRGQYSIHAWR